MIKTCLWLNVSHQVSRNKLCVCVCVCGSQSHHYGNANEIVLYSVRDRIHLPIDVSGLVCNYITITAMAAIIVHRYIDRTRAPRITSPRCKLHSTFKTVFQITLHRRCCEMGSFFVSRVIRLNVNRINVKLLQTRWQRRYCLIEIYRDVCCRFGVRPLAIAQ